MARAKSGRCTQLPGGNDGRAEDHAYDYGQQHLFHHWTLLLLEERRHADFLADDSLERATRKNPNKHRREANKKISDLRSAGFIMEPPRFVPWTVVSLFTGRKRKSAEAPSPPRSLVHLLP
jgi:hypothetical protein